MKLLILGGTAWLGREVAAQALARGHDVACLARGQAGPVAAGAELITADRDAPDAYAGAAGRSWDVAVDVASQPGRVRRAVAALAPVAGRFVYVSSCSVYADEREAGQDETAPVLAPLEADTMASMADYGSAKVACEQAALGGFGTQRTLVARAGLIAGPGDGSGRTGYWPWRFANPAADDGRVLVPDDPHVPVSLLDVRDLAAWLVAVAEEGTAGTLDVTGPSHPLGSHLELARRIAGHTGRPVPAPRDWLVAHGVQAWMGPRSLPLWLDDPEWYGMNARSGRQARDAGLGHRPVEETLADTLAWEQQRPEPGPHGAGLTDEEERELLDLLAGAGDR